MPSITGVVCLNTGGSVSYSSCWFVPCAWELMGESEGSCRGADCFAVVGTDVASFSPSQTVNRIESELVRV